MSARSIVRAGAAIALVGAAALAGARAPEGPDAFLRRVYAPYLAGDSKAAPTGKAAPSIFDARLTALIRKDQADAKGEVGALDQDPICDCQDFDRLTRLSIKVLPQGAKAKATVRFVNGETPATLRYSLVRSPAGWRVSDVGSKDMPSLVALLQGKGK